MTDCQDMTSLQSLLCMGMYLQATGRVDSCHTVICLAHSLSARMGLHRAETPVGFSASEQEIRRRVFWSLRTMDTYVHTMLGLPTPLKDAEIDQGLPSNLLPEPLSQCTASQASHSASVVAALVAHIRLLQIMAMINSYVQADNAKPQGHRSFQMSYSQILEVEEELKDWFAELPSDSSNSQWNLRSDMSPVERH